MELDRIWDSFIAELNKHDLVLNSAHKKVTGIPFLYIHIDHAHINDWEEKGSSFIHVCAKKAMYKKKVTAETHFFRQENNIFVYRHRFYVPQEKMFCCGNLCEDCIRLRKK
jgi:hypothetical protein